jgi:predicted metalloprotease with PDZ domain
MFGDCATVETIDAPVFERGFDTAATGSRDGFVAGVDPRGAAYAAGLRNGMRILRREGGKLGDPATPVTYHVEDHGVQKAITWLPAGRAHVSEQRIVLASDMSPEKRARCTRVMAGEVDALPAPNLDVASAAPVRPAQPVQKAVEQTVAAQPSEQKD